MKDSVKRFSCNLDAKLYDQMHDFAEANGMKLCGVLTLALKYYLSHAKPIGPENHGG